MLVHMRKTVPPSEPEASPLDVLPFAVAQRDPGPLEAVFTPDADVRVHGVSGWSWTGAVERQAAWSGLLASVPDLTYVAERRYLSPEMHSEEGRVAGTFHPADGSGGPQRFDVSLRMIARLEAEQVTRLEVWGDVSGLPASLGPLATGGAAVVGSMAALRGQQPPAELRVLGTAQADRTPAPAAVVAEAEAVPEAPSEPRRPDRRRRLALVAGLLAVVAGLSAVAVTRVGVNPEPQDTLVADASAEPEPSVPPAEPSPTEPPEDGASSAVPEIEDEVPTEAPQVQAGEQLVLASDVLFETGSSVLSPEAVQALTDLSRTIRERQVTGTVQINGYTDNTGSDAIDLALSQARALAVAQVLQRELAGVPVRLEPQGFGKADPVADNGTAEGRAQNRRVTIVLPEQG